MFICFLWAGRAQAKAHERQQDHHHNLQENIQVQAKYNSSTLVWGRLSDSTSFCFSAFVCLCCLKLKLLSVQILGHLFFSVFHSGFSIASGRCSLNPYFFYFSLHGLWLDPYSFHLDFNHLLLTIIPLVCQRSTPTVPTNKLLMQSLWEIPPACQAQGGRALCVSPWSKEKTDTWCCESQHTGVSFAHSVTPCSTLALLRDQTLLSQWLTKIHLARGARFIT